MWTPKQKTMLKKALADPNVKVAYWCSDAFGGPANHPTENHGAAWRAYPGRVDTIKGKVKVCSDRALHATDFPHRWRGVRVFIVALSGFVDEGDKYGAKKRTIIGEVMPEVCIDPAVGARIGMSNLSGSNLSGSNLYGSNLSGSNLYGSNLSGSNLYGSDLSGSNLYGSDLSGSNLYGSDLSGSNLSGSNLSGSNLGSGLIGPDGQTYTNACDLAKFGAIVNPAPDTVVALDEAGP